MVCLQAAPLLLDDPVAFRFQWPRNSDLKTNSVPYRVYSRQPTAKVGPNVRDEPANLSSTSFVGRNKIRLQVSPLGLLVTDKTRLAAGRLDERRVLSC